MSHPNHRSPGRLGAVASALFVMVLPACLGSTTPAGSVCPATQTQCGDLCVDLQADRAHCGACDAACADGEVCSEGGCALTCQSALTDCEGSCRDLQTDEANCGYCGEPCAEGYACEAGSCALACTPGQADCGGTCRDLAVDPGNCGACGTTCGAGEVCSEGVCAVTCQQGLLDCSGACRDVRADRAHCGGCDVSCAPGQVCSSGQCVLSCQAGLSDCGGSCRDLETDRANCGACGNACPPGQACDGGACIAWCAAPLTACGDACVDAAHDPLNCGACDAVCPTEPNAYALCLEGGCLPGPCHQGWLDCSPAGGCETHAEVDLLNCGACGNACSAPANTTMECVGGACAVAACAADWDDCDGEPANGCESSLQTTPGHCGACGNACPTDETCQGGLCVPGPVLLTTVCGKTTPYMFAGGDCSFNHDQFANWWCQLGGYTQAVTYDVLTAGTYQALYYQGGATAVLSSCSQVMGPTSYGLNTSCTAVRNLYCQ